MQFGCATLEELDARLTPQALHDWQEFYLLEPFGPLESFKQAASLGAIYSACHGGKLKAHDIFPILRPPEKDLQLAKARKIEAYFDRLVAKDKKAKQ